jgi:hypothetical protein
MAPHAACIWLTHFSCQFQKRAILKGGWRINEVFGAQRVAICKFFRQILEFSICCEMYYKAVGFASLMILVKSTGCREIGDCKRIRQ